MVWVVVAAVGLVVALSVAFWEQIVRWANVKLATWLGALFGEEFREAFLMLVASLDRFAVLAQRTVQQFSDRIVRARILFRQLTGGREHEKVIEAEIRKDDGEIVKMESAEVVPWHELPDDVREKFIRRQTASVEIELKLKQ